MSKISRYVFEIQERNEFNEVMNGEDYEHHGDDIGREWDWKICEFKKHATGKHVTDSGGKEASTIPF